MIAEADGNHERFSIIDLNRAQRRCRHYSDHPACRFPARDLQMLRLILAVAILGSAGPAYAGEVWRCAYTDTDLLNSDQVLVQYRPQGQNLVETLASGATKHLNIVKDNKYGVIAVAATAEAPQHGRPRVNATTIVIEKLTGDFWRTTTIGGQPGTSNQPVHGSCFKP